MPFSAIFESHEHIPFDYPREKIYCGRCGRECQPLGHMFVRFLMCPTHGEFTIAPTVMEETTGWYISFHDATEQGMWETCKYVDEQGLSDATRVKGLAPDGDAEETT